MLIALGLFMFTFQSVQFNLQGFLLVLGASFLSGLRWTLAQIVLQKKEIGKTFLMVICFSMVPTLMDILGKFGIIKKVF